MYDDWNVETVVFGSIDLPPDAMSPANMLRTPDIIRNHDLWIAEDPATPGDRDAWTLPASDDEFVLWSAEQPFQPSVKPGADEDWLTPLASDRVDDVVVTGRRHNPTTPGGYYNPADYGEWDGHDTSQTEPPPPLDLPDCVADAPANVDQDALMRILQHLTAEFRGVFNDVPGNIEIDSSRYEYGVVVYELNGQIGYGDITTNYSDRYVNVITRGVPDGARIILWMHNHPDQPGVDDRLPSSHNRGDWDQYNDALTATLQRGITVDPNLLMALYSIEDDKTRVYDKTDKNKHTPSCPI